MLIVLTPYKSFQNGNVGARLVEQSAIELVNEVRNQTEVNVHYRREDFTSRIDYLNSADAILIPNFHLTKRARPKLYRICKDLSEVEPPIIPINGFYKFNPENGSRIENQNLDRDTAEFLNYVKQFCAKEEIPARSDYVFKILEQNGYNARMVGDPGWYDPNYIGDSFHKPSSIQQLVFTPPHDQFYTEQAKSVLRQLGTEFEGASKIISMHCAWDKLRDKEPNEELAEYGAEYGWESRYTSHRVSNLDFYKNSDLHVGYLKHGHLAHLRWRIPSIVLAEDSRALGLTETLGTAGFPAFDYPRFGERTTRYLKFIYKSTPATGIKKVFEHFLLQKPMPETKQLITTAPNSIANDVISFIRSQQSQDWEAYDEVESIFDTTYKEEMIPYLDKSLPA